MPMKAPRICSCGKRVPSGVFCACQIKRKAEADLRRPSAHARGYDSKWQKESRAYLAMPEHQFCACKCGRKSNVVDHKTPHKGDMRLFWDRKNWQPLNSHCHNSAKQSQERSQHKGQT